MPWILTPPVAYMMEGMRLARELEAQGIVLDKDQIAELARASLGPDRKWVDEEPVLSPEGRAILERIATEREQRLGQVQAKSVPGSSGEGGPAPPSARPRPGSGNGQSSRTAPDDVRSEAAEDSVLWSSGDRDQGQDDHTTGQVPQTYVQIEKNDRISIRDHPDEDWTPS